jgi:hypothetical protein
VSYQSPQRLYGLCWGTKSGDFRLAASSFIPGEYVNKLQVRFFTFIVLVFICPPQKLGCMQILHPNPNGNELISAYEIDHPYPPTKLMWSPHSGGSTEYLATTADYLRLWTVTDTSVERHSTISNVSSIAQATAVKGAWYLMVARQLCRNETKRRARH